MKSALCLVVLFVGVALAKKEKCFFNKKVEPSGKFFYDVLKVCIGKTGKVDIPFHECCQDDFKITLDQYEGVAELARTSELKEKLLAGLTTCKADNLEDYDARLECVRKSWHDLCKDEVLAKDCKYKDDSDKTMDGEKN